MRMITDHGDNYGSFEFLVCDDHRIPENINRVPVDARYIDADGIPVDILLHVVSGMMYEIEIVKLDGNPLINGPRCKDLDIQIYSK